MQKIQDSKEQESLLRKEQGSRTIAPARLVDPERFEPDPSVAEAEDRGAAETTAGNRIIILVTSAVDPEIIIVLEPLRVGQQHNANLVGPEATLFSLEDLASPAN